MIKCFEIYNKQNSKSIGYRIVGIDNSGRLISNMSGNVVSSKHGSIVTPKLGLYLGTTKKFVLDYYTNLTDLNDVLLTYEYNSNDIISGSGNDEGEIIVSSATLIASEPV